MKRVEQRSLGGGLVRVPQLLEDLNRRVCPREMLAQIGYPRCPPFVRLLAALVPLLTVLMTVLVGAIILSVLLPIYDLTSSL